MQTSTEGIVCTQPRNTERLDSALKVHVFKYSNLCQVQFHVFVCLFVLFVLLVVGFIYIMILRRYHGI
jgi:hypothetical protein